MAIDLFCGLGGWTDGLLAEGYRVIGFDNERHVYGEARYPAQLVLQDVLTIHGSQFASADLIVASPPCQEFSYMAMPWSKAKQIAAEYRDGTRNRPDLTALFDACFRIQREAVEAAGRFIPLVVENVRGAQPWVGRAKWHFGSFYLWGDVPALMPMTRHHYKGPKAGTGNQLCAIRLDQIKNAGGSWFNVAHNTTIGKGQNPDGRKMPSGNATRTAKSRSAALQHYDELREGFKGNWLDKPDASGKRPLRGQRATSSRSMARKAASAHIAKIPLALSRHIARAWWPYQHNQRVDQCERRTP